MARINRSQSFPRAVETTFNECWPGFRQLATSDRGGFIMLMISAFRHRRFRHNHYEDHICYHYQDRDRHFGRGRFKALNADLKLIDVQEHWQVGEYTKGYRLTDEALTVMESIPFNTTQIIDTAGTVMKTAATWAINERDANGNHRKGKGNLPAVIDVDIEELFRLAQEARQWRWHFKDKSPQPAGRRLVPRLQAMPDHRTRINWLTDYLIAPLTLFILEADTAHLSKGQMEVTYTESTAGRLYAVNGSIQTVPREIRAAALRGCCSYDIENCHYSLVGQMANHAGKQTPAIQDYLNRKREIRLQLVQDINAGIDDIKKCLLALLYGATQRVTKYEGKLPAIADTIGPDKAKALFAHPLYAGLAAEVKAIRKPILESMPINRTQLINPFGKGINLSEPPAAQLAHALQGSEALILDTVIQQQGANMKALIHDGWVTKEWIDRKELEKRIEAATGFRVELEEKLIA